jgi:hypothetical protein
MDDHPTILFHSPHHAADIHLAAGCRSEAERCGLTSHVETVGTEPADFAPQGDKGEHTDEVPPAGDYVAARQAGSHLRPPRFLDDVTADRAALDRWENEGGATCSG